MIQLQSQTLIVCHEDGRMEPLQLDDLIQELSEQSDLPSVLDPWVMEKVIESIIHHFRNDLQQEKVSLIEFVALTKQLLESFLREAMQKGPCYLQLDLLETAQNCGNAFELEFYNVIRRSVHQYVETQINGIADTAVKPSFRITGLRQCAKYLSGRQRWSKSCSQVRDDIVSFIRAEVAKLENGDFSLAVLS